MKRLLLLLLLFAAALGGGATAIVQDQCGPFTDVTPGFCPFVLELYYLGITAGTSATTFSPDDPLTRGQGAVFIAKGLNQALARSSRRAALGQWWTTTPHYELGLGIAPVDSIPLRVASDGADVWSANLAGGSVSRVRASDGKPLQTWTGANSASDVVSAMGRIFVTGRTGNLAGNGGSLYAIDPTQSAGAVSVVAGTLWNSPEGIAFDGTNLWVVSLGDVIATAGGALSIVHPGPSFPWSFTTIKTDVELPLGGIVFDGRNIWFVDGSHLKKMDSDGVLLQSVDLGHNSQAAVFDGQNIWVTSVENVLTVVSAANGSVVATLSGNGLDHEGFGIAFDGERILVTNFGAGMGGSLSLWRAATLEPLGVFPISDVTMSPYGACSDGVQFWIALYNSPGGIGRF